ncbi:MAG: metalloregulator ArsR/SmtB family transcription factor [Patescibacteria group bacterium]
MRELEKILKALANRRRLAIIKHLKTHQPASVGEIAATIKLSFRSTSKHLAVLASADIVEREQSGLQIFYFLTPTPSRALRTLLKLV